MKAFQFAGLHAGYKKNKKDLALIYCPSGADWAGVFTRNLVKAAPVQYDQELLNNYQPIKAVLVNSGNANACTGHEGLTTVHESVQLVAEALQIKPEEVAVSSTGVIGVPMSTEPLQQALPELIQTLAADNYPAAAEAILTTDTMDKCITHTLSIEGQPVNVIAFAKGSGMIHPNMGTMLAYVMTDAVIDPSLLQRLLQTVADRTFNAISVDGDTSTNDTLLLLTSQTASHPRITDPQSPAYQQLAEAIESICQQLAQAIVRDGEGATKFVDVHINGAATQADAIQIGRTIATSPLVKTALFGQDANWGRIIAAIGYAGVDRIDPDQIDIAFSSAKGRIELCRESLPLPFDEAEALAILKEPELTIHVDLHQGSAQASVWTCDMSYDYIKINADYRS